MTHLLAGQLLGKRLNSSKTCVQKIVATSPIVYWPLNELSGLVAINRGSLGAVANGVYDGPTLAQLEAPGGGLAPYFDNTNDLVNLYSAAFAGAFNGQLGSLMVWWKVGDAARWTDGAIDLILDFTSAGSTYIQIFNTAVNNTLGYYYDAANTLETVTTTAYTAVAWHQTVLTWSLAGDAFKAYTDGVQTGLTQTSLGTWNGALAATTTTIGALGTVTKSFPWHGYLAHCAVWTKVLSDAEILALYVAGL